MEGNFCPTAGGATFSVCTRDANSCFFVSASMQPCTAPQTCTATGVVAAGTACGCAANGTTLNSGCGNVAVNATSASSTDNAVLRCEMVGACKLWRILVNCADQSLTAGTDVATNTPACVCKPAGSAPGAATTVYVDPDPPMATFMTNNPTGALQPPACRFRSIASPGGAIPFVMAAANASFRRIVAIHETSSNVHFAAEPSPLAIPSGIELTTADGPSFNPAHYTIDLLTGGGGAARVTIGDGTSLSGFTLGGATLTGAAAASPLLQFGNPSATGTMTASAHHLALVGSGMGTGILVTANGTLTSDLVSIANVGTAISVDYPGTGTTPAAFTGTSITGTGIAGTGVALADASSRTTLGSSNFTVTGNQGIQVLGGQASLTNVIFNVSGAGGFGIQNNGGQVTLVSNSFTLSGAGTIGMQLLGAGAVGTLTGTAFSLTNVTVASRGIDVLTGTPALTVTGGSVTMTVAAAVGAVGVDVQNAATASLTGITVTTSGNTHGVRARDTAMVTINGASVITNSCAVTAPVTDGCGTVNTVVGSISGSGVIIPAGLANVGTVVNVGSTTQITKYQRGIEVNDGSLAVTGTVQITGNTDDGIRAWGLNDTTTTTVAITGATITGNGDQGVSVNTEIPTTVQTSTINSNKSDGIIVQSSQDTAQAGYRFLAQTNTVRLNGGRGIYVSGELGRSGVRIENNTIAANVFEGIRISELAAGAANVTEVSITGNTVNGNLTAAATAPADVLAGGIFFTQFSTAGVSGPLADRIILGAFQGNRVFGNGRHEIGFDLPQEGTPSPAWDISSNAAGVDMAMVCSDSARPNFIYCYDTVPGEDLGLAVPANAAAMGILVKAKGVHFQTLPPIPGRDFSVGITAQTTVTPEPAEGVFLSCSPQTGCI